MKIKPKVIFRSEEKGKRINRFATIVSLIHSLPVNVSFHTQFIAEYLSSILIENREHYHSSVHSTHRTVCQYMGKLKMQGFIRRISIEYATFENGGNGKTWYVKDDEFPELIIKQLIDIK